jgi:hypothetical protein
MPTRRHLRSRQALQDVRFFLLMTHWPPFLHSDITDRLLYDRPKNDWNLNKKGKKTQIKVKYEFVVFGVFFFQHRHTWEISANVDEDDFVLSYVTTVFYKYVQQGQPQQGNTNKKNSSSPCHTGQSLSLFPFFSSQRDQLTTCELYRPNEQESADCVWANHKNIPPPPKKKNSQSRFMVYIIWSATNWWRRKSKKRKKK